jgi:hypothetical protein
VKAGPDRIAAIAGAISLACCSGELEQRPGSAHYPTINEGHQKVVEITLKGVQPSLVEITAIYAAGSDTCRFHTDESGVARPYYVVQKVKLTYDAASETSRGESIPDLFSKGPCDWRIDRVIANYRGHRSGMESAEILYFEDTNQIVAHDDQRSPLRYSDDLRFVWDCSVSTCNREVGGPGAYGVPLDWPRSDHGTVELSVDPADKAAPSERRQPGA